MSKLAERTVTDLRQMAGDLGIEYSDAKEAAGGKTPNKSHWIEVIQAHPDHVERVDWDPPETKYASELTRAGLLAGVPDDQLKEIIAREYPDYGALDIAIPVYRRELRKKGLLPDDG